MATAYKKLASYLRQPSGADWGLDTFEKDTDFGNNMFNTQTYAIAEQPDGKILVGGQNSIKRLNRDGSNDNTFDGNSYHSTSGAVRSIAVDPLTERIFVGGHFSNFDGNSSQDKVVCLNNDGSVFSSFGSSASPNSDVNALLRQPDGKILLGGAFTTIGGVTMNKVARVTDLGQLDTTFADPNIVGNVLCMALQPDGKILIGGQFTSVGGDTTKLYLARLNSDGSLDTTFFHPGGGPNREVNKILVLPNGEILVGGTHDRFFNDSKLRRLTRISKDGFKIEDKSNGSQMTRPTDEVYDMAVAPDGSIIVAGDTGNNATVTGKWGSSNSYEYATRRGLYRCNEKGELDKNFAPFDGDAGTDRIRGLALLSDGSIVYGYVNSASTPGGKLKRKNDFNLAYTVPSETKVILKNVFAANQSDVPVTYALAIVPEADVSGGVLEKHYYAWNKVIDKNDYDSLEVSVTLSAGDQIHVLSSLPNVSFNIFGLEKTE